MYASGSEIFKFSNSVVSTESFKEAPNNHSIVAIIPNPFSDKTEAIIEIVKNTTARLDLLNSSGQIVQNIYAGQLTLGSHPFDIKLSSQGIPDGNYFLVLRTNEELITKQLIKGEAKD